MRSKMRSKMRYEMRSKMRFKARQHGVQDEVILGLKSKKVGVQKLCATFLCPHVPPQNNKNEINEPRAQKRNAQRLKMHTGKTKPK